VDNQQNSLKLILTHLLGKPVASTGLEKALAQIAADPEALAWFEQLEYLLSEEDETDWLEAIAAASEGLTMPEIADFLGNKALLAEPRPEIVAQNEALMAAEEPDPGAILPVFPDFIEQFKATHKSLSPGAVGKSGIPAQPSFWETVESAGRSVLRLFTEIPVLTGPEGATFGRLPDKLSPVALALPAARDKDRTTRARELPQTLPLPSPEHDLALSLNVGPVSGDKATLSVQVHRLSSGQPLSRVRVTIQDLQGQALESDLTPENGTVIFQSIEPGRYRIEVRYRGQVLELPIAFAPTEESGSTKS
jgi:hypothetical protein